MPTPRQVDVLVRAKADRVLGKEKTPDGQTVTRRLFDTVRNAPARGAAQVEVQRLSARVKASKQARKDRREARVADVTLRYQPVTLPCPGAAPVQLWVVPRARGTAAACGRAAGVVPVDHVACDQRRRRHAHPAMVRPALAHRRILSGAQIGCKVEELQHHTAERLERAMAIKMVIGWRIQLLVQLGREVPDLPGELLFSDGGVCACSPPSPARGRCRHPRASATRSV